MSNSGAFPSLRLRRLRASSGIRDLIRETRLSPHDFIYPLFIKAGKGIKTPIDSMPRCFQWSVDQLEDEIKTIASLGIPGVLLFGLPSYKDAMGSSASKNDGVIQEAIRMIKKIAPELLVITDLCFCEYTDHGHCGVVNREQDHYHIHNDETLELLGEQALSHAEAGADIIAPSGMMDGMVQVIRQALDHGGFSELPILSYSVKYASALYGPFREAAEGVPQFGDRKTYQMDPANSAEALREAELDVLEGADMLMVKPAGFYLDVIKQVKKEYPRIPLGAYQVSGEYAMILAAAEKKWLNEEAVMMESLMAIKRAGADFIITYFAKEAAQLLLEKHA